mmetsp:Transcript_37947/g.48390  ORF Transcript_37947/g.48390 Transcript_37947/m.48390 type:complete len:98 (-) Transcript_37947:37-330(-)
MKKASPLSESKLLLNLRRQKQTEEVLSAKRGTGKQENDDKRQVPDNLSENQMLKNFICDLSIGSTQDTNSKSIEKAQLSSEMGSLRYWLYLVRSQIF